MVEATTALRLAAMVHGVLAAPGRALLAVTEPEAEVAGFELDSTIGRAILTGALALVLVVIAVLLRRGAAHAFDDPQQRYNARRFVRTITWVAGLAGLALIWRPLGGNLVPAIGLATAGLAFAMQEVVGAIAGWFNITFGGIFKVGDRIRMGGVEGDVIDISLLKTRMMEIGGADDANWVQGRQYTGRVVSISNKASFTDPVFNYSSWFEYIWEEVEVAVPHHADWGAASDILEREARALSATTGAAAAMRDVRRRFPVPATEVEPRVFASADETHMRLAVRFVVPVRTARSVKDALVRRIHLALEEAGIEVVVTQVIEQAAQQWRPVGETAADGPSSGGGDADPGPPDDQTHLGTHGSSPSGE